MRSPTLMGASLLLGILSSVGLDGNAQPSTAPGTQPRGARVPNAHESPEWQLFVGRLVGARSYYRECGDWDNPADPEEDKHVMEALLGAAGGLQTLAERGELSEAEMALLRMDAEEVDRLGGRSYRKTRLPWGGRVHWDYFAFPEEWEAYQRLRRRIPDLERLADQGGYDPVVLRRALQTSNWCLEILRDPQNRKNGEQWAWALYNLEEGPRGARPPPANELRAKAALLIGRIEAKAGIASPDTRSRSGEPPP